MPSHYICWNTDSGPDSDYTKCEYILNVWKKKSCLNSEKAVRYKYKAYKICCCHHSCIPWYFQVCVVLIYSHAPCFIWFVSSPLCSLSHLPSVYCVTSQCKDDRYKAPPPTPPGYQGLSLGDMQTREGEALRPAFLKPPKYNVALQRSKLLGDTWRLADGHHPIFTRPVSVAPHAVANSEEGMFSKPPDIMIHIYRKLFARCLISFNLDLAINFIWSSLTHLWQRYALMKT